MAVGGLAGWGAELQLCQRRRTVGPCCATFGPRSLARRRLGVSAKGWRALTGRRELGAEVEKPATAVPGGLRRKEVFDAIC